MTLYRIDRQYRIPTEINPSGYYVWTNQVYVECATEDDYEDAIGISQTSFRMLMLNIVEGGPYQARYWPSGAIKFQSPGWFDHNTTLPGTPAGLTNVVVARAKAADGHPWRRLIRVPLRTVDIGPDGNLSASAYAYYAARVPGLNQAGRLRTHLGVEVGEITVSPRVHSWQLRHGTKRRAESSVIRWEV